MILQIAATRPVLEMDAVLTAPSFEYLIDSWPCRSAAGCCILIWERVWG